VIGQKLHNMAEQTLYDSDGNEKIVPDDKEITSLKESQTKVDELTKAKEQLEKDKKELEAGANPNWKEVRENKKRLEATIEDLKKQGKSIDDEGKIIDAPQPVSQDDMTKTAQAVTNKTLVDNKLNEALSQLPEDKRKQVKDVFDKLIVGTELNLGNFSNYFEQASRANGVNRPVDPIRNAVNSQGGLPVISKGDGELTQAQRSVASQLGITEKDLEKHNK